MEITLEQATSIKKGDDGRGKLYFYGDIVSSYWGAWGDDDQYPASVKKFLNNQEGPIDIYINSAGGNVFACAAIYNMLRRYPHEKVCYIDGLAASAASVIALAGDRVVMPANAIMMIHRAWACCSGNTLQLEHAAKSLRSIDNGIIATYKANSSKSEEELERMMDAETWMNGTEAAEVFSKIELAEAVDVQCRADKSTIQHFMNTPEVLDKAVNVSDSDTRNKKMKLQAKINLLSVERRKNND